MSTERPSQPEDTRLAHEEGIDPRYYVESVGRAVHLLRGMSRADKAVTLTDLVELLGWNKASVYRLLRTLEAYGVVRKADNRKYVLGPLLITLGQQALRSLDLPAITRPHLEALHNDLDETSNVAILDGDEVVYIARVEGRHILGARLGVGARLPAYCTSMGQVLLADLSDEAVERCLSGATLDPWGPNTLTTLPAVLERLELVRRRGYALNDQELAAGHRAVGAPVRDYSGRVVAAVNVSVAAARVSRQEITSRIVPRLLRAAEEMSADLGASRSSRAS